MPGGPEMAPEGLGLLPPPDMTRPQMPKDMYPGAPIQPGGPDLPPADFGVPQLPPGVKMEAMPKAPLPGQIAPPSPELAAPTMGAPGMPEQPYAAPSGLDINRSYLGPGTYPYAEWPGLEGWKPQQEWWRDPGAPAHVIWNPKVGWQMLGGMQDLYKGAYEQYGKVPGHQIFTEGMGITPQGGPWSQWYDPYQPPPGGDGDGGGGLGPAGPLPQWTGEARQRMQYSAPVVMPDTGVPPLKRGVPMPQMFGKQEQMLRPMMRSGQPVQMPDIYRRGLGSYREMMESGAPADWGPWYQQAKRTTMRDLEQEIAGLKQRTQMGGKRYSSGLARQVAESTAGAMERLGTTFTEQQLGAYEQAMGRRAGAVGMLPEITRTRMAPQEAAQERRLAAGEQAFRLGAEQAVIPERRAAGAGQYGMQAWPLAGQMQQPEYAEWLRTQWMNSPMAQYASQYAMGYPAGAQTPQMYDPLATIMGGLFSGLGGAIGG